MTIGEALKKSKDSYEQFEKFIENNEILKENKSEKQTKLNVLTHLGNNLSDITVSKKGFARNSGRLFESVIGMLLFNGNNVVSFPGKHFSQAYKNNNSSKGAVDDPNYDIVINDKRVIQTKLTYQKIDPTHPFYSSINKLKSLRPIIENGYVVEEKDAYDYYFAVFENNEIHFYRTKLKNYLRLTKKVISLNKDSEEAIPVVENGKTVAAVVNDKAHNNKRFAIIAENCDYFEKDPLRFTNEQVIKAIEDCLKLKDFKTHNMRAIAKGERDKQRAEEKKNYGLRAKERYEYIINQNTNMPKMNNSTIEINKSLAKMETIKYCLRSLEGRFVDIDVNTFIRKFGFENKKGGIYSTMNFYKDISDLYNNIKDEQKRKEEIKKKMKDYLVNTAMFLLKGKKKFHALVTDKQAEEIGNICLRTKLNSANLNEKDSKYLDGILNRTIQSSIIAIASHL